MGENSLYIENDPIDPARSDQRTHRLYFDMNALSRLGAAIGVSPTHDRSN